VITEWKGRTGSGPFIVVYGAGNLGKIWSAIGQNELLYKRMNNESLRV